MYDRVSIYARLKRQKQFKQFNSSRFIRFEKFTHTHPEQKPRTDIIFNWCVPLLSFIAPVTAMSKVMNVSAFVCTFFFSIFFFPWIFFSVLFLIIVSIPPNRVDLVATKKKKYEPRPNRTKPKHSIKYRYAFMKTKNRKEKMKKKNKQRQAEKKEVQREQKANENNSTKKIINNIFDVRGMTRQGINNVYIIPKCVLKCLMQRNQYLEFHANQQAKRNEIRKIHTDFSLSVCRFFYSFIWAMWIWRRDRRLGEPNIQHDHHITSTS